MSEGSGGLLITLQLFKGTVIIYVEGRGRGERKIYWKDQNFCKAPPPGQVISK